MGGTTTCDFCGERFTIGRHSNQRSAGGKRIERHRFCCPAHRLADYRRIQRKRSETQASTPLAASVSGAPKRIENKRELAPKNDRASLESRRWSRPERPSAPSCNIRWLARSPGERSC